MLMAAVSQLPNRFADCRLPYHRSAKTTHWSAAVIATRNQNAMLGRSDAVVAGAGAGVVYPGTDGVLP
jgi:hypothetical protein